MSALSAASVDDTVAIRASWMRGGTCKGVFFAADDLPAGLMQRPGLRDALLLRLIGSPDPFARHCDGLGGATSATSKVVVAARSRRAECDVEFLVGAVSMDAPSIDWSGSCGNLAAAVGPFAIAQGWVAADADPMRVVATTVRLWQQNIGKRVVAHVPTRGGRPVESGGFQEDGVPCPGAEIRLEFVDPAEDAAAGLLPTGNACDLLHVPELEESMPAAGPNRAGTLRVTLLDAGAPVVFVRADALKLTGRELPDAVDRDPRLRARLVAVRARAAVAMGLSRTADGATRGRSGAPEIAFVAAPTAYRTCTGADIDKEGVDVVARFVSMGRLDRAITDSGSIAVAVAAALPGTVVSEVARTLPGVPTRIGHASGVLAVGAVLERREGRWHVERAVTSRSARRLMEGTVFVPR